MLGGAGFLPSTVFKKIFVPIESGDFPTSHVSFGEQTVLTPFPKCT